MFENNLQRRDAHIQPKFNLNDIEELGFHSDGKLLPALTGVKKFNRLVLIEIF